MCAPTMGARGRSGSQGGKQGDRWERQGGSNEVGSSRVVLRGLSEARSYWGGALGRREEGPPACGNAAYS